MKRSITGFQLDPEGDWIADLDCGHGQHVRHRPPFINRPWTESGAGRDAMLGTDLECVRCDRMEWPEGLAAYRRTPEFDETTAPAGLKRNHTTRRGIWGRIHVLAGALQYHVDPPVNQSFSIAAGSSAIIVPDIPHRVDVTGEVRFFVEFSRPDHRH